MSTDLLARLITAGTPADLVAEVAMEMARAATERDALAQRRKADAGRTRRRREREAEAASRDNTGRSEAGRDIANEADATPLDKKGPQTPKELNPPTPNEADASLPPAGAGQPGLDGIDVGKPKRASRRKTASKASRLATNWQAPPIEDLPLEIQAIVKQWPAGAYEITALGFRNHWISEGRAIGAKRDWPRTWCNWLVRESAQVLRAARAGVRFAAAPTQPKTPGETERDSRLNAMIGEMQKAECRAARAIRAKLKSDAGERTYQGWIRPCAIAIDGGEITVMSASDFHSNWIEQNFGPAISGIGGTVLGRAVNVFFRVVKPPGHPAEDAAPAGAATG